LAETPSAETPTASAAWEVDALQWPTVTDELLSNTQSYFSQAGKKLASAVHDGLKVLGVLGCVRGEGCSTLAMTLARAAAREGINVALVDGDLAEPQLAQRTSLEMSGGWHEAARGQTKIAETAIKSLADKLTFYPLEPAADLSLTDARVSKAWQQIAQRHTLVILDLGPAGSGDTPIFATTEPPPVDAVVIVRDIRRTSLDQVHALAQRLHKQGIDAVGMAENFVGTPST
jgi:Mrp family chromosome partitioning ATPase